MASPTIGRLIRDRMHAADLNQTELSERMRLSKMTVSNLINSRHRVTPNTAARLAKALGEDARWWLERQLEADLKVAK